MLEIADVGFVLLDLENTNKQVVVWYVHMPRSPVPIMIPVYGGAVEDEAKFFSRYRQLSNLEQKAYSALP